MTTTFFKDFTITTADTLAQIPAHYAKCVFTNEDERNGAHSEIVKLLDEFNEYNKNIALDLMTEQDNGWIYADITNVNGAQIEKAIKADGASRARIVSALVGYDKYFVGIDNGKVTITRRFASLSVRDFFKRKAERIAFGTAENKVKAEHRKKALAELVPADKMRAIQLFAYRAYIRLCVNEKVSPLAGDILPLTEDEQKAFSLNADGTLKAKGGQGDKSAEVMAKYLARVLTGADIPLSRSDAYRLQMAVYGIKNHLDTFADPAIFLTAFVTACRFAHHKIPVPATADPLGVLTACAKHDESIIFDIAPVTVPASAENK